MKLFSSVWVGHQLFFLCKWMSHETHIACLHSIHTIISELSAWFDQSDCYTVHIYSWWPTMGFEIFSRFSGWATVFFFLETYFSLRPTLAVTLWLVPNLYPVKVHSNLEQYHHVGVIIISRHRETKPFGYTKPFGWPVIIINCVWIVDVVNEVIKINCMHRSQSRKHIKLRRDWKLVGIIASYRTAEQVSLTLTSLHSSSVYG
jgi:hypothetical protein